MEWALDGAAAESVTALRREIMAYLRRHAEPDSDLAGAEVVVAELLTKRVPARARPGVGADVVGR